MRRLAANYLQRSITKKEIEKIDDDKVQRLKEYIDDFEDDTALFLLGLLYITSVRL